MSIRLRRISAGALAAAACATPLAGQGAARDSAGVSIVTTVAPTAPSAAVVLGATPRVVIASGDSSAAEPAWRIRAVSILGGGRVVVADGVSGQLRYYSQTGAFEYARGGLGQGPGQIRAMSLVRRVAGDTIVVVTGIGSVARFDGVGNTIDTAPPPPRVGPPRSMIAEVLASGHEVLVIPGPVEERPKGERWVATATLQLRAPSSGITTSLGPQPMSEMEQTASGPVPRWLSPIAAIAASPTRIYLGFGARYEIRAYAPDGTLQSVIRRRWTPAPITDADWETWVVEWSKRWVTTIGAERERDVQAMREAPWANMLPAFSQFIVDRSGRLWVRGAHWQDAIAAGSYNDVPVLPSEWSVFDTRGAWLYDVVMPAYFEPFEIGADYVAGRLVQGRRQVAAVFPLVPATVRQ